jgi:hypothetical protein
MYTELFFIVTEGYRAKDPVWFFDAAIRRNFNDAVIGRRCKDSFFNPVFISRLKIKKCCVFFREGRSFVLGKRHFV